MQGKKNSGKRRPFTKDTGYLICIWHSRGESAAQIANDLQRDVKVVRKFINEAKKDGRYDRYVAHYKSFLDSNRYYENQAISY